MRHPIFWRRLVQGLGRSFGSKELLSPESRVERFRGRDGFKAFVLGSSGSVAYKVEPYYVLLV
jgi:hypothetical protein